MSGSCLGVFPEAAIRTGPWLQASDSMLEDPPQSGPSGQPGTLLMTVGRRLYYPHFTGGKVEAQKR